MPVVVTVPPTPPPEVLTPTQFRAYFNAFNDPQMYPDGVIEMYAAVASMMLLPQKWVEVRPLGMALYIAHMLVLDQRDTRAAANGQIPGAPISGVMSSKSVGSVSVSYDTQTGLYQDAGFWNLSIYGIRFYRLLRLVGMAGTQLGGPDSPIGYNYGRAWPGVIYPIV